MRCRWCLRARNFRLATGLERHRVIFAALHHAHAHPGARIVAVAADSAVNYVCESFDQRWLAVHGLPSAAALVEAAERPPTNR
jgi:hypothetical protein